MSQPTNQSWADHFESESGTFMAWIPALKKAPLHECPVRDRCLLNILAKSAGYRCGFELAGTVEGCPRKGRER